MQKVFMKVKDKNYKQKKLNFKNNWILNNYLMKFFKTIKFQIYLIIYNNMDNILIMTQFRVYF